MLGAMKLNLTADEVLTTTRSVRKRLDFDRPVERAIVERVPGDRHAGADRLEPPGLALGRDRGPATKQAVADVYRRNFEEYRSMPGAEYKPRRHVAASARTRSATPPATSPTTSTARPLLLIPCLWGRLDNASVVQGAGAWGSLLPAVWSFMLALRERGMGSAWTTIHLMNDGEREVAELARHPVRQGHRRAACSRSPTRSAPTSSRPSASRSSKVLHWDRW